MSTKPEATNDMHVAQASKIVSDILGLMLEREIAWLKIIGVEEPDALEPKEE